MSDINRKGYYVRWEYEIYESDGDKEFLDSTDGTDFDEGRVGQPVALVCLGVLDDGKRSNHALPDTIEEAIEAAEVGQPVNLFLTPDQGWGTHADDLVIEIPLAALKENVSIGDEVTIDLPIDPAKPNEGSESCDGVVVRLVKGKPRKGTAHLIEETEDGDGPNFLDCDLADLDPDDKIGNIIEIEDEEGDIVQAEILEIDEEIDSGDDEQKGPDGKPFRHGTVYVDCNHGYVDLNLAFSFILREKRPATMIEKRRYLDGKDIK